jgi:GMP synthase-like glutamine amidotransferase
MGAVYSVYDNERLGSWIGREVEFLRQADADGVPVFGVCFGGQLLAAVHGGSVVKGERNQVGWHSIPTATPQLAPGPWMQWHYDRFEPPPEATVLSSDNWGTQAFRLRRNLGVQFHPEVDGPHLQGWFDYGGVSELERFDMNADELMAETIRNAEISRPHTNALVDWFLSDIATTPETKCAAETIER